MPSGVSPSRKHSTTPARMTATPTASSFEGRFLRTTASKRITTTGMAYCSTMALAAEVYLLAMMNSTEVAMTPNAPSQLPKVLAGRKSRRARPRKDGGDEGARAGDGQRVPGDEAGEQAAEAPANAGEQYAAGGQAFHLQTRPFRTEIALPSRCGGRALNAQYASLRRRMPFLRSTSSARAQSLT